MLRDEVGDTVSLCIGPKSTPDFILGNSLPSLSGLDRFSVAYPALRAGLLSARAVQISRGVGFVALILLDKRGLRPGMTKPGW